MAKENKLGAWAFLIGVILAVVIGIIGFAMGERLIPDWAAWVLFILGLVVGLLNISDREVGPFLTAGAILVLVAFLGSSTMAIIPVVSLILNGLLVLFVPATIIVALKSVFGLAKK